MSKYCYLVFSPRHIGTSSVFWFLCWALFCRCNQLHKLHLGRRSWAIKAPSFLQALALGLPHQLPDLTNSASACFLRFPLEYAKKVFAHIPVSNTDLMRNPSSLQGSLPSHHLILSPVPYHSLCQAEIHLTFKNTRQWSDRLIQMASFHFHLNLSHLMNPLNLLSLPKYSDSVKLLDIIFCCHICEQNSASVDLWTLEFVYFIYQAQYYVMCLI